MNPKELCLELVACDSEDAVVEILRRVNYGKIQRHGKIMVIRKTILQILAINKVSQKWLLLRK